MSCPLDAHLVLKLSCGQQTLSLLSWHVTSPWGLAGPPATSVSRRGGSWLTAVLCPRTLLPGALRLWGARSPSRATHPVRRAFLPSAFRPCCEPWAHRPHGPLLLLSRGLKTPVELDHGPGLGPREDPPGKQKEGQSGAGLLGPPAIRTARLVSSQLGYLAEETSNQSVEGTACVLLAVCSERGDER